MCGICGKLSWERPPEETTVKRMNAALAHRGPDAEGIHIDGPAALGHRRLSVIDLSEAANQPLSDTTGRYWIVYNGEIYNYPDIRKHLIARGVQFRTSSDTEVILEAFKQWGADCLERFNGMWAFAVWDRKEQRMFLARDRVGKKPLYYYTAPSGTFIFASDLNALQCDPLVPTAVNPVALNHYLTLNYTLTDACIVRDVHKLPAAHCMFVDRNGTRAPQCYWNLAEKFAQKQHYASANEAAEALNALLDDAVRLRLISDVPLGAFLSGGMDSSSIIAAMCRLRAAHMNRTFSIGFREKTYSELPNARAVADFLDVSHHDRTVVENMAEKLPRILAFTGEPFADSSIIPMFFLAKFAREHVTVALSGDGGDELFAGYDTYAADKLHPWLSWLPGSFARNMRTAVQSLLPVRFSKVSTDYKIRKFLDGISYDRRRAHYSWRTIFSNTEKRALLKPGWQRIQPEHDPFCIFRRHFNQVNNCPFLDQCMYVDIKTWMVDDILVKVDRATMAHGLEARAPILDYRLVEFAAGLPVELKLRGWDRKYILKHSQQQILPQDVLARAKRGFNAPVAHWMETSLEIFYRQLLDSTRENSSPFNTGFVRQLWDEHRAHRYDNSLKLLSLMNFQLWHKAHQERIKQNQYA